jgi:hypothetical protein
MLSCRPRLYLEKSIESCISVAPMPLIREVLEIKWIALEQLVVRVIKKLLLAIS